MLTWEQWRAGISKYNCWQRLPDGTVIPTPWYWEISKKNEAENMRLFYGPEETIQQHQEASRGPDIEY